MELLARIRHLGHWIAHWNYGPDYTALDSLPAIQDGHVDAVSEPDEGELHAAISTMNNPARTFTEARDILNRARNARGCYPVVSLAVPPALENGGNHVN